MSISGDRRNTPKDRAPPQARFWVLLRRSDLVRHLLAGLPAVLAGAAVLVLAGMAVMTDQAQLRARYAHEALGHFQARDYQAALIGFERVARWDGPRTDREVRYNHGICLEALDDSDHAAALIEPLAPEDRPGYAPAHVWKATRLWSDVRHSPDEIRAGEKHLLFALRDAPDSVAVNTLLGQFYMALGQTRKAIPFLEKAVRERPELLLPLARANRSQGNKTLAQHRAKEARRIYRERAEANLYDHESRLLWADAAVFLEDFSGAADALRLDALLKTDPRFPRALARIYLAWSDAVARTDPSDLAQRLALLERGLACEHADIALLGRFSELIRTGGPEGGRARQALLDLVTRGRASGPVRYALGLDAWENGRPAEARLHWEEACRLMPETPAFVNNLAWILAQGPEADLPRALDTINPVLKRWPGDPHLRATRGEILAKLERWKEALPDLEAALTAEADNPALHRMLAETYEHLGAPAMAAEHSRRAAAARSRPASGPAEPSSATAIGLGITLVPH